MKTYFCDLIDDQVKAKDLKSAAEIFTIMLNSKCRHEIDLDNDTIYIENEWDDNDVINYVNEYERL